MAEEFHVTNRVRLLSKIMTCFGIRVQIAHFLSVSLAVSFFLASPVSLSDAVAQTHSTLIAVAVAVVTLVAAAPVVVIVTARRCPRLIRALRGTFIYSLLSLPLPSTLYPLPSPRATPPPTSPIPHAHSSASVSSAIWMILRRLIGATVLPPQQRCPQNIN